MAVGTVVALVLAALLTGGGVGVGVGVGASRAGRHDAAVEQAQADQVEAAARAGADAVAAAVQPELEQLRAQLAVTDAARRVTCEAGGGAWGALSCVVAMQGEVCDEAGVGAGQQVASCTLLTRTADLMARVLFCDAMVDQDLPARDAALERCLKTVGQ